MPRRFDIQRMVFPHGALRLAALARVLAVVFAALTLLAACAPREPAEGALLSTNGDAIYSDGVYIASFSHTGTEGWQPFLHLRIRSGLISESCYGAVRADGTHVRNDENYIERFRLKTGVALAELLNELAASLIAQQQVKISISARRVDERLAWSYSFLVLAEAALDRATLGDTNSAVIPEVGPYIGHDRADELGWEALMIIIFGEAGVAAVSFQERRLGADGTVRVKGDDQDYTEAYERVLGLNPGRVATELSLQFVQAGVGGESAEVIMDGLSGATGTSNRFRLLASEILTTRMPVPLPSKVCLQ